MPVSRTLGGSGMGVLVGVLVGVGGNVGCAVCPMTAGGVRVGGAVMGTAVASDCVFCSRLLAVNGRAAVGRMGTTSRGAFSWRSGSGRREA